MGVGGSIPFIATFQEMFPEAAILVTGVEDPYAGAHGPNESLHLGEFARVCLAEALLLRNVAAMTEADDAQPATSWWSAPADRPDAGELAGQARCRRHRGGRQGRPDP